MCGGSLGARPALRRTLRAEQTDERGRHQPRDLEFAVVLELHEPEVRGRRLVGIREDESQLVPLDADDWFAEHGDEVVRVLLGVESERRLAQLAHDESHVRLVAGESAPWVDQLHIEVHAMTHVNGREWENLGRRRIVSSDKQAFSSTRSDIGCPTNKKNPSLVGWRMEPSRRNEVRTCARDPGRTCPCTGGRGCSRAWP